MDKTKTKIIEVNIGKYEVDSIVTKINGKNIEICFDKNDDVSQYIGKEVFLSCADGKYIIEHATKVK